MAAREEEYGAINGSDAIDHAGGAGSDFAERFAARESIAEHFPIRAPGVNVRRPEALILAVVPLDEVAIDFGARGEARELAGPAGALQRAGEDAGEIESFEPLAETPGVTFAAPGQRQIGEAGVLSTEGPCRLAVAGKVDYLMFVQSFFPGSRRTAAHFNKSDDGSDLLGRTTRSNRKGRAKLCSGG